MQKTLLLMIMVLCAISINSQVLFQEDFNDGTRGEMTAVDNDGNTPNANVGAITEAWQPFDLFSTGDIVLVSNSWYNPPAAADDWLITPALNIDSEGYSLIFQMRAIDATYSDGYKVKVSTTDNELASFTDEIFSIAAEQANGEFVTRLLKLDDYVGETIYIAIQNDSYDKYLLVLDNIQVAKIKQYDPAIVGMTNRRWNLVGDNVTPTFRIANNGSETITSLDLSYTIDGETKTETLTGLNIAALSEADITVSDAFTLATEGEFSVEVTVSNPNGEADEDDTNNTAVDYLNSQSDLLARSVVVEEGTGTWCGWCPRGHVFMELMKEKYTTEDFIGIAVHNGDVMTIEEHDGNLGITGFPGAHVNRAELGINPSDMEQFFAPQKAIATPVTGKAEVVYNEDTREVTITATAVSSTTISNTDIRFSVIMTEDHVTGTTADYNQVNYYSGGGAGVMGGYENLPDPVPAADMIYNDVSRAILGSFFGEEASIPSTMEAGVEYTATYTYTIPAEYDPMQMQAVVVVLDAITGEVLNADEEIVQMPVNIFETPESIIANVFPNPTNGLTNIELDLNEASEVSISVNDLSGKLMNVFKFNKAQGHLVYSIDVTELNAGIYLLHIDTNDGVVTKKLTVSK